MADDDELAHQTGRREEWAADEPARRAWTKPGVQRFALQKTLAGSSFLPDGVGAGSETSG